MKVTIGQVPIILFPDQSLIKYINKILIFMMSNKYTMNIYFIINLIVPIFL